MSLGQLKVNDISGTGTSTSNDIRVRIPSTWGFTWDTSVTGPTFAYGGSASGKVSTTVSYPTSAILLIDVTSDLGAADEVKLSGLKFRTPFTDRSPPSDFLELLIDGGTNIAATDRRVIALEDGLTIKSAAQTISGSASSAALEPITVRTGSTTVATSDYAGDLRISIPIENNLSFSSSQSSASVAISGTGVVASSTPTIEDSGDGNRTLRWDVTTAIGTNTVVTITGLKVDNGSASTETLELLLSTAGPGQVDAALVENDASNGGGSVISAGGGGGGGGEFIASGGSLSPLLAMGAASALVLLGAAGLRRFRR